MVSTYQDGITFLSYNIFQAPPFTYTQTLRALLLSSQAVMANDLVPTDKFEAG